MQMRKHRRRLSRSSPSLPRYDAPDRAHLTVATGSPLFVFVTLLEPRMSFSRFDYQ